LRSLLCIIVIFLSLKLSAQSDSVPVTELAPFNDGLYLTNDDHRHNRAISKENIVTTINKDQVDFYYKLTSAPKVVYTVGSGSYTVDAANIWGFVQNKTLFINYKGVFYRVPVFGSISYFAGVVEVTGYYTGVYDPMYGMGGGRAVKTKELNEFLLSYYDGKVINFDMDQLEKLISNDEVVYKEYKSLSKRKRRKQVTHFVRMYNDRHPVYYLK
jgi:hypothetical protein